MANNNELINFFNIMWAKKTTFEIAEGILQDVRGLTGRASIVGNPVSQEVFILQGSTVSVGNRCLCIRPKSSAKWVVIGSFGTHQTGYLPQRSPEDGFEIYPPGSLTAESIIPGCCLWHWNAPPEKAVVFDVQTSLTASEDDVIQQLRTRGSYFVIDSGVNLFIRVRSITSTYNFSAWSDWVECEPAAHAGTGDGSVTSVAVSVPGELSVAGSPITVSGTFAFSWVNESANKIFAGPNTGSPAAPAFRDQVLADSPTISSQRLVGRHTAGSGKFEELVIGAGLYIVSDTMYASATGGGESLWSEEIGFIHPITLDNRVVIGDDVIDDAAAFEVVSTDGGILIPRMTTSQRDALPTPPVGMMIYNTTDGAFEFFQVEDLDIPDETALYLAW